MYYITNANGYPIAADKELLSLYEVDDIEAWIRSDKTPVPDFDGIVEIGGSRYRVIESEAISLFGPLRIVKLAALQEETNVAYPSVDTETSQEREEETDTFDLELDLEAPLVLEEESETAAKEETQKPQSEDEKPESGDDLIDLLLPTEGEIRVDTIEEEQVEERAEEEALAQPEIALFDETETDESVSEIRSVPEKAETSFDPEKNAAEIGVTLEDYLSFVEEYAQSIESLRGDLLSGNEQQRNDALEKLEHLANVLRLDGVIGRLSAFKAEPTDTKFSELVETVRNYTTEQKEETESSVHEKPSVETDKTKPAESGYLYDDIDLSDVKPIHFDFTIEEAANDLSLPAELIEEFIFDFIKQAHEETERMIEAYRKGDLETVQKIGHLLKGTSSNLRITPLADTLYEIQFNDDIERVPELVRNYWAHFLSLENQMQLLANK
jgi:hypothetical protein